MTIILIVTFHFFQTYFVDICTENIKNKKRLRESSIPPPLRLVSAYINISMWQKEFEKPKYFQNVNVDNTNTYRHLVNISSIYSY